MALEMCRICSGTNQLKNVLGDLHLLELLRICANITVTTSDLLPKQLCQQCELGLEFSYGLRKQGEETEKRLRQALEVDSQGGTVTPNEENLIEVVDLDFEHEVDEDTAVIDVPKEEVEEEEEEFQSLDNDTYVYNSIMKLDEITAEPYEVTEACDYIDEMNDLIEESVEEEQTLESICLDSDESNAQSVELFTGTESEVCNVNGLKEEDQHTENLMEETDGIAESNASIVSYTCATCDMVLHNHHDYRQHIKLHGDKRFNCKECNKWFPSRFRLQAHELCHRTDVELHKCPQCERSYRLNCNLVRHIRTVHEQQRFYKCAQCGTTFGRADVLKNHMLTHVEERNFNCTECKHSFKSQRYLDQHMRTHQPKEPKKALKSSEKEPKSAEDTPSKKTYYCVYCGKISNHHFTHKNHLRIHTKERPYKCETCAKEFRTMAAMITHERIHVDVRPYQCEHCLLSFRQQSHLKEHQMIHSGLMPHVCSVCNIAFTKKSNMLVHMRVHSGEKPYKCAACEQEFKKLALLRRHAKTVHGNGDLAELAKKRDNLAQLAMMAYSEDSELDVGESQMANIDVDAVVDDKQPIDALPCPTDLCSDLSDVHFGTDDSTMVFMVDDNAKFNSLYIMDD